MKRFRLQRALQKKSAFSILQPNVERVRFQYISFQYISNTDSMLHVCVYVIVFTVMYTKWSRHVCEACVHIQYSYYNKSCMHIPIIYVHRVWGCCSSCIGRFHTFVYSFQNKHHVKLTVWWAQHASTSISWDCSRFFWQHLHHTWGNILSQPAWCIIII